MKASLTRAAVSERPAGARATVGIIIVLVGVIHVGVGPRYHGPFRMFVTGYLIDILLPVALYLGLGLFRSAFLRKAWLRAALVFGAGAMAETSQGLGIPLAGKTFDPLDYVAYAAGVAFGLALEKWMLYRAGPPAPVETEPIMSR